jgi:hypothetical protein
MSNSQPIELPSSAPPCALCKGDTDVKNVLENPAYIFMTYKCTSCGVEHHVKKPRPEREIVPRPNGPRADYV